MKYAKLIAITLPGVLISACGSGDALDAVEQAATNINNAVTDLSTAVNEGLENTTLADPQTNNPQQPTDNVQTPVTPQAPTTPVEPEVSVPPTETEVTTRPEIFEDYQYSCSAYSNPDNTWVWSFRPELDMADQFNLIIGTWEWIDNLQIRIRPQGNPEVLGTLNTTDGNVIFLENWGQCNLRFGRSLADQFTRPN
jgi:hypothetical protein